MIFFKGHVDKESLGLHFLRNFQVCLFSIAFAVVSWRKISNPRFIKICNEKGLKERKGGKIQMFARSHRVTFCFSKDIEISLQSYARSN